MRFLLTPKYVFRYPGSQKASSYHVSLSFALPDSEDQVKMKAEIVRVLPEGKFPVQFATKDKTMKMNLKIKSTRILIAIRPYKFFLSVFDGNFF